MMATLAFNELLLLLEEMFGDCPHVLEQNFFDQIKVQVIYHPGSIVLGETFFYPYHSINK